MNATRIIMGLILISLVGACENKIDTDDDGSVADSVRNPDDRDNDSWKDADDNCPTNHNLDQQDSDADGRGDVCDPHPNVTDPQIPTPTFIRSSDRDNDGWSDSEDNCPEISNPTQASRNDDEVGDACDPLQPVPVTRDPDDRDGDGWEDFNDNCPDTSNPVQSDQDGDGVGDACDLLPLIYN